MAWLDDEKKMLMQQHEETERRNAEKDKAGGAKRRRGAQQDRNPDLGREYLEDRLQMGLALVKYLANAIHVGVLNTNHLKTELGCEGFSKCLQMQNTSLLVSVQRKLEPYPGRTGATRGWMGKDAVRFYQEQRGTVPAQGAAPAAEGATQPAAGLEGAAPQEAKGAAPPAAEGKVRTS